MIELPNKPGRYNADKSIMLCVPSLGKPFFEIRVSCTKAGHQQQLTRKLYVNVTHPYLPQLEYAIAERYRMESALERKVDEYVQCMLDLNIISTQKEHERNKREREAAERLERRVSAARRDVWAVCAVYGPAIEMRKPFFIQQWI